MMDEGEYHKSSKDDGGEWNGIPIERPHHYHFHYQHTNLNFGRDHSRTYFARDVFWSYRFTQSIPLIRQYNMKASEMALGY